MYFFLSLRNLKNDISSAQESVSGSGKTEKWMQKMARNVAK